MSNREMHTREANVDAWADALGDAEDPDRACTAGTPDVLVERREDERESAVELRVRGRDGTVSSVILSPDEARTLAGQLRAAAVDQRSESGDGPGGA